MTFQNFTEEEKAAIRIMFFNAFSIDEWGETAAIPNNLLDSIDSVANEMMLHCLTITQKIRKEKKQ